MENILLSLTEFLSQFSVGMEINAFVGWLAGVFCFGSLVGVCSAGNALGIKSKLGLLSLALSTACILYVSGSIGLFGIKDLKVNSCFTKTYKESPIEVTQGRLKHLEASLKDAEQAVSLGKKFGVSEKDLEAEYDAIKSNKKQITQWHEKKAEADTYPKTLEFMVVAKSHDNRLISISNEKKIYSGEVIRLEKFQFKRVSCSEKIVNISKTYDMVGLNK